MRMKPWLDRQGQRRRFFFFWAVYAVILVGSQITGSATHAALIHAHVYHWPPLWVFGADVPGSAILAAVVSRRYTGRVAN
jgi:hypothetical protein